MTSASSGASRCGVEVRPERFEFRRDPKVGVAVDLLRNKRRGGHQWVRQNERKLSDPKWVAQAHRVVGSELETAAEAVYSGERFWAFGGMVFARSWGEGERGAGAREKEIWGACRRDSQIAGDGGGGGPSAPWLRPFRPIHAVVEANLSHLPYAR